MDDVTHRNSIGSNGKDGTSYREQVADMEPARNGESSSAQRGGDAGEESEPATRESGRRWWNRGQAGTYSHSHFKVYKRRWFGLAQLVLLNIVVSWDVSRCGWLIGHAL
jgi:FLVCR family MFS transporter 7